MDLSRQRQLELEAEAEFEFEEEQRQAQSRALGPDYNRSLAGVAGEAITESPRALGHMVKGIYDVATPYSGGEWRIPLVSSAIEAGPERSLETVGSLAAGTAGAAALAPVGAGIGTFAGPFGTIAGGLLGGAAGFGAGLLGFDLVTDATTKGEFRPTSEYAKDFVYNTTQGAVLGGPVEAARVAMPRFKSIENPYGKIAAERKAVEKLQELDPSITPERIDEALVQGVDDPFLEYKSLGELLDNAPMKSAERTISRTGPESYGKANERYLDRNDAQLKYLDDIEQSPLTPEDVQASIREAIETDLAAKQSQVGAAENLVDASLESLPPKIPVDEAGALIREGVSGGKEVLQRKMTEGFNEMGTGVVDTSPVRVEAAQLLPQYFKEVGAQPNPRLVNLIEGLTKEGVPTGILDANGKPIINPQVHTLKDIQALRSEALDIAQNSDPRTASVANQLAQSLKEAGDMAVASGKVSLKEIEGWKQGIGTRKEIGEKYESSATPAKAVLAKQPYGEFKLPESAVPSKYWRSGKRGTKEAIRNYKETVGNTSQALEPLYRYAVDSFRDYVVVNGKVDIKKFNKWKNDFAPSLEELPELRQQLSSVENSQRLLNERFGNLQRTQKEVEKGAVNHFLQADVTQAVPAMLSGKDMIKRTVQVTNFLKSKDPDAVAGLRRGIIEHIKKKSFIEDGKISLEEASKAGGSRFDGTVKNAVLKNEWERIRPALVRSKVFTDSQMKAFDYLYRDKTSQLLIEKSKMPGGSDTVQNASTLASLAGYARKGFLSTLPGGKYITAVVKPVLDAIPEVRFREALEEALLNPRIARDLMNKASARNVAKSAEGIFQEEFKRAFGDKSVTQAVMSGAPTAAAFSGTVREDKPKPKPLPTVPKQQEVTSSKSFPTPDELTTTAQGSAKKVSFNVQNLIEKQRPETQARIATESSGDPFAVSPKGAQGLAQLMPNTAREIATAFGEKYTPLRKGMTPEEQRAAIEQNIRFGDYYYDQQLEEFKNPTLAWAAYNAGPRRVREAIVKAGTSRDVNKILASLPPGVQKETIPYVQKIMAKLNVSG